MRDLLKQFERIIVAIGIVLTFFVLLEVVRAYETLSGLHPWAGYGFLFLLGVILLFLVGQLRPLFHLTAAPRPPEIIPNAPPTSGERRKIIRYLEKVYDRLSGNELLMRHSPEGLLSFEKQISELKEFSGDYAAFPGEIESIEKEEIAPLLRHLDKEAEAVVSDSVGVVSLGTALSPYRSVDFAIVLMRNIRMVNRILKIYRTRPTARETALVFYDITRVVAAVNLLNAMDQVWAGIGRHIPLVGAIGEALSEGLFSGLLTSVAGHAAIDRCRSYHPWSTETAARKYRSKLPRWGGDIYSLLIRHGVQRLLKPGRKRKKKTKPDPVNHNIQS